MIAVQTMFLLGITGGWAQRAEGEAGTGELNELSALKAKFQEKVDREIEPGYQKAVETLKQQYATALDRAIAAAAEAANLEEAVSLREEKQRIEAGGMPPEADLDTVPEALQKLRAAFRTALAKIEADRRTRQDPLLRALDKELARLQDDLTRAQRLDDALKIRAAREQLVDELATTTSAESASVDGAGVDDPPPAADGPKPKERDVASWVLSVGGGLLIEAQGKAQQVSKPEELPKGRFETKEIVIHQGRDSAKISDDDLARLESVPGLEKFELIGGAVQGPGLSVFPKLPRLKELTLDKNPVGDDALMHLAKATSLERLSLKECPLTGAGLKWLAELQLTDLFLNGTKLDNAGAELLARLPALWWLNISGTQITSEALAALKKAPRLGAIDASRTNLSGPAFASVLEFPRLKNLYCTEAHLTDAEFKVLSNAKNLEVLAVNGNAPSSGAWENLGRLKALQVLVVGGDGLTGEELTPLSGLPELSSLEIWGAPLTAAGWDAISESFPRLRSVSASPLKAGDSLTPAMVASLARLKSLDKLTLHHYRASNETMEAIAGLTGLKTLDLTRIRTSASSFSHLANLPNLEELNLRGNPVTDDHVRNLTGMKMLKLLVLTNTRTTGMAIDALKAELPGLNVRQ